MSETNILNISSGHRGATCGCSCVAEIQYEGFGWVIQALCLFFYIFPRSIHLSWLRPLPVVLLPHILFQAALVWSSSFDPSSSELSAWHFWHRFWSRCRRCELWLGCGCLHWHPAVPPDPIHLTVLFLPSRLLSCTAKGSLSSWIKAGCPSRRRRQRDNARYLWWVVSMTLRLQRLFGSN